MKRKQVLALLLAVAMTANMSMPAMAASVSAFGSVYEDLSAAQTITEDDLAAAMLAVTGKGTAAAEEQGAEKEETVYVFTDANGNLKSMTVSNWLKNRDGSSELYDRSIMKNIENVRME